MNAAPAFPILPDGPPRSGIVYLRNRVAADFAERGVPAIVTPVGAKYRTFNLNQYQPSNANRVVFIPGSFSPGAPTARAYGELSRDTRNSSHVVNPRELASWSRPITVSLWSAPAPGKHEDEQDAIALVEDLLEQLIRALQFAGAATLRWGAVTIVSPPSENSFGAELLLSLTQIGPIFDSTLDVVAAAPAVPSRTFT